MFAKIAICWENTGCQWIFLLHSRGGIKPYLLLSCSCHVPYVLWNINAYHLRYCFEVPETTPPDSQSIQQWIHDSQALEESVSQVDAGMQCLLEPAIPEITIGQAPVDSPSAVTPSKGHAAMDGSFALCPSAASAMGSPPAVKRKNSTVADIVAAPKPSKKNGLLARLVGGTAGIMPPPVSPLIVTPPPAGPHVPAASPPPVSVKRKLLFTDRDQPRKQRQWCREKTAVGQSIAQEAGLDFNKHLISKSCTKAIWRKATGRISCWAWLVCRSVHAHIAKPWSKLSSWSVQPILNKWPVLNNRPVLSLWVQGRVVKDEIAPCLIPTALLWWMTVQAQSTNGTPWPAKPV